MYESLLLSAGGGVITENSKAPQIGSACVMIGIGGTGLAALRRVKKEVYQHLTPDDPNSDIPKYSKIAFLGIDTDLTDLTVLNPDPTDLQAEEQWSVNVPNLGAMLRAPQTKADPNLKWMSDSLSMQGDQGAGGCRQAGRFCLFKRSSELRAKLQEIVNHTMSAAGKSSVQVHVFAGISGGTGSGCFLDVCYILRDVLSGVNSTVCGYFFLPDIQLNRPGIAGVKGIEDYNKRNGFAALRDLDYCMSLPASGGKFTETYAPGFTVVSGKAPVDLCHLISGTTTDGVLKPDAFNYGMSVVADYVLTYLSDVQGDKANDDKGLTIEGFAINVNQALKAIPPRVGAQRNYHIVGASSAELPLTHIATYLASTTYCKMLESLTRHANKGLCDGFAKHIGFTADGLLAAVSANVVTGISYNPNLNKDDIGHLNEDLNNWNILPEALCDSIEQTESTARGRIEYNRNANAKDLDNYDHNLSCRVETPTLGLRLFNELCNLAATPSGGPTMAADLLCGNGLYDLRNALSGAEEELKAKKSYFEGNLELRARDIREAAHDFNHSLRKNAKLLAYEQAWQDMIKCRIDIELCGAALALIPHLKNIISNMYQKYFSPLANLVTELGKVFKTNLDYLASDECTASTSFAWRIFEYTDIKENLDETVLRQQDMGVEHTSFVNHLIDNYKVWNNNNSYRSSQLVNDYMTKRFGGVLNQQVDSFLTTAFKAPPNMLPKLIQTNILNKVHANAAPLFWVDPTYQLSDATSVSNNVLNIPYTSASVVSAAAEFMKTTSSVVLRKSTLVDRISCLQFKSGIPLYAYHGIKQLRGPYDSSKDSGLHLHERDVNWRQMLPSMIPYSVERLNTTPDRDTIDRAAMYDECEKEKVVCPRSPKNRDEWVVRIIPSTETLVSEFQKERYYFAGKLNMAELEKDITRLKIERERLLPETVPDETFLRLENDGFSDSENSENDFSQIVRRDYFVRFVNLREVAIRSLTELKRIDEKLAEMESWKGDEADFRKKVERCMRLDMMGYLKNEGSTKFVLQYTYHGVPQREQVCDVNSTYRFAPEYQILLALDTIDPKKLEALDAELEKKALTPVEEWRPALERMIGFDEAFLEGVYNDYLNDVNRDAIPAFYRALHDMAADQIRLLGPKVGPKVTKVIPGGTSTNLETDLSGWTCRKGTRNPATAMFCPCCGERKPAPQPDDGWTCSKGTRNPATAMFCSCCGERKPAPQSDGWTCSNGTRNPATAMFCPCCGERKPVDGEASAEWVCANGTRNPATAMFCPCCGQRKPAGGGASAPVDWFCANCHTKNPATSRFCCGCGSPKP